MYTHVHARMRIQIHITGKMRECQAPPHQCDMGHDGKCLKNILHVRISLLAVDNGFELHLSCALLTPICHRASETGGYTEGPSIVTIQTFRVVREVYSFPISCLVRGTEVIVDAARSSDSLVIALLGLDNRGCRRSRCSHHPCCFHIFLLVLQLLCMHHARKVTSCHRQQYNYAQ